MAQILNDAAARNLGPKILIHKMLSLAEDLRKHDTPFDSETYEHILSAYSKGGHYDKIIMLLHQMEAQKVEPKRNFFDTALKLSARYGNSALQAKLLLYMEKYGIEKTSKTYRYMLRCMRENAELERALDTITEMKKKNIEPSALSYLDIVQLAVLMRQPLVAFELLCSAKRLDDYPGHSEFLYLSILRSAAYNGEYGAIKALWKEGVIAKGYKPDEGTCIYIMNIAGKHGDMILSRNVISYIGQQGYPYRECHFQALVESFATKRDMKAAFELFHSMRLAGVIPNRRITSWIIPTFYTDKNAVNSAKDALEIMINKEPEKLEIAVFNLMIHVLAVKEEYDEALSVLDQLYKIGLQPNSETLDAVLDICIHDQNVPLGKTLYNRMISQKVEKTSSVLSKMVTLMSTSDDYEDAFKYLEEMKQLGMTPYRGAYYQLVKVLASSNDPRLSMALEDMSAYNYEQSTFLKQYIEKAKEMNSAM